MDDQKESEPGLRAIDHYNLGVQAGRGAAYVELLTEVEKMREADLTEGEKHSTPMARTMGRLDVYPNVLDLLRRKQRELESGDGTV